MAAAVDCRALRYAFNSSAAPALDAVTLALAPGSWTLLAGRSGSGKSTLLTALAGLLDVSEERTKVGDASVQGLDPSALPASQRAALVGLVRQSPDAQICTTTVEAEVAFGLENLAIDPEVIDARISEALAFAGLTAMRQRRVSQLSGGERQRLVLAAVLAMRPQVLLLDEPLSQLDPSAAADFLSALDRLRNGGPTIVVAEHRLSPWLDRIDRLVLLDEGKIAANLERERLDQWGAALAPLQIPARPSRPRSALQGNTEIVSLRDVSFTFDRSRPNALEVISLRVNAGERVAIVGLNGSGKSTLLSLLARIHAPNEGALQFADRDLTVGFVPQNPDLLLFCRTVREELAFAPRSRGCSRAEIEQRVQAAAEQFDLLALLDRRSILLSQGERLRVAVAATWTLRPKMLLLDEPTTGQDPWHEAQLMDALTSTSDDAPSTLIFSTHDLSVAERYADRVIVMESGRMIADDMIEAALAIYARRRGQP